MAKKKKTKRKAGPKAPERIDVAEVTDPSADHGRGPWLEDQRDAIQGLMDRALKRLEQGSPAEQAQGLIDHLQARLGPQWDRWAEVRVVPRGAFCVLTEEGEARLRADMGARIRAARAELGFSQMELAAVFNKSPAWIGGLEAGEQYPPAYLLVALASKLRLDVGQLYGELASALMLGAPAGQRVDALRGVDLAIRELTRLRRRLAGETEKSGGA